MFRRAPLVLLVAAAVVGGLAWVGLRSDSRQGRQLSGYLEGDLLYMGAPVSGAIKSVYVVEGQRAAAGAPLFSMDPRSLTAQLDQTRAQVAQAQAQVAAARASLAQLKASAGGLAAQARNAAKTLARDLSLRAANPGAISIQTVDNDQTSASNTDAQRSAADEQAQAALAQVKAAQAAVRQAEAARANIKVQLAQLQAKAPVAARVQAVLYQSGEWASANQPVVALLPDDKVKVRFFVPETALGAYQPGRTVHFRCDSCAPGLTAKISYVSPQPEYTPPIIYSRDSRDKLVFMVEALPTHPRDLTPGEPVEVAALHEARTARK